VLEVVVGSYRNNLVKMKNEIKSEIAREYPSRPIKQRKELNLPVKLFLIGIYTLVVMVISHKYLSNSRPLKIDVTNLNTVTERLEFLADNSGEKDIANSLSYLKTTKSLENNLELKLITALNKRDSLSKEQLEKQHDKIVNLENQIYTLINLRNQSREPSSESTYEQHSPTNEDVQRYEHRLIMDRKDKEQRIQEGLLYEMMDAKKIADVRLIEKYKDTQKLERYKIKRELQQKRVDFRENGYRRVSN
jgi:hypothetical protein